MSFAQEAKQEVAQKIMQGSDARAELSAMLQLSASLTFSSEGTSLLIYVQNAAVTRRMFTLIKDAYDADMELFVQKRKNLKKNRIYGLRVKSKAIEILKDVGIYSGRGLREKPLKKIVQTDNNARAYLAGAFLVSGSVNSPETSNYHLEITTNSETHAEFLQELLERFYINSKRIVRRNKWVVYIKSAESIADFLRCIEAEHALLEFENIRITRDFTNSLTRLNNMDVANEIKAQAAAANQLKDIEIIQKAQQFEELDEKLKDVALLRIEFPESTLNELASIYEKRTGVTVSKSGMKHRFNRIHEYAEKCK